MLLHFIVASIGFLFYLFQKKVIEPPKQWAKNTTGNLLGEVHIHDEKDTLHFAKKAVTEAKMIWNEPTSNFEKLHYSSNLVVEGRRITEGPFQNSSILLTRSSGVIIDASPQEVYNHLISPKGIQILDPSMDPEKVPDYIERYNWKGYSEGSHLDVHESFNPMPFNIKDRYHVVLNGYDKKGLFFFCKSIVHDSRPGSSIYYDQLSTNADLVEANAKDNRVRAINTFYFRMKETKDKKGTFVEMANYADFMLGSTLMNWMIGKAFYPGVYERLQKKFVKVKKS